MVINNYTGYLNQQSVIEISKEKQKSWKKNRKKNLLYNKTNRKLQWAGISWWKALDYIGVDLLKL